jgi:glycosyltransferase involved in cell wall biosynthesis
VLPSGLNAAIYHPPDIIKREYALGMNDFLLFLGRIDPIKRIDWLLRAAVDDPSMAIVIAGGAQDKSTEKYFQELRTMAIRDSRRVIFTGPVYGAKKAELLSNCRLFVNPSMSEGLPIAVLEAMSYQRCCLGSDIPAHQEVISNGRTGFLFEHDNVYDFERMLKRVLRLSTDELNEIGGKARAQVSRAYDWDRTAFLTEQIYGGLVNEKRHWNSSG